MITDEKIAIQFAEYMAKKAELFLLSVDRLQHAIYIENDEDIDNAEASVSENFSKLELSIYEFRKRSEKVIANS
jgi:hypothetical protein